MTGHDLPIVWGMSPGRRRPGPVPMLHIRPTYPTLNGMKNGWRRMISSPLGTAIART